MRDEVVWLESIYCPRRKLHSFLPIILKLNYVWLLLSGEENMIKAFQNNEDVHKSTASKVLMFL
jgi:hypothetical protein